MSTSLGAEDRGSGFEIQLQVPSKDWLEVYGILAQSLTLDQLLPSLGFLQSSGHVESLQHSVSSQYADGLFIQHQDSSGNIYNLCGANPSTLAAIENDLQKALALFKARHNWLTTGSRLSCGVIYERKVVLLLDSCATEHARLRPFLDVAVAVTKEQLSRVEEFNIIRCSNGVESWQTSLTESSEDNITSAVQWMEETEPQTVPFKTNIVEGVLKALAHSDAQGIYLLTQGDCTLRALDLLLEKVSPSLIPVHVVVYDCKTPQALDQYKQLANASSARCHSYVPPPVASQGNPLLSSFSSLSSAGSHSPPLSSSRRPASGRSTSAKKTRPHSAAMSLSSSSAPVPSEDIRAIMEEIELTRNTLAEVQALQLEVGGADLLPTTPTEQEVSEESLTSQQWLEIYGLKAKKLLYEDLVASLAFQHCNGIVQIPVPKYKKSTQTIEVVPHAKIVHAQYCKDFVHIRWNEDKTVHVQLTSRAHRTYRGKVESTISRCEGRLQWLKKGSRQLFGTLLESRVVIVIDTSSSVKERLGLIKNKVEELLQEQLSQKKEFTIMHFNSEVHPWRTSLVPTSPQNLQAVGQWVQGLLANGSTNTLRALETAMSVREAEAVYLLTDGRPDQPLDEILSRVQQLPSIPVHTISFNCADSKANFFLAQLASNTGGRYYYFSEDTSDPEGPNTYQSEDIQKLEEEVECGHEQLQLADHLLSECNAVRRRGRKREGKKGPGGVTGTRRRSKCTGKLLSSKKWLEKNSLSAQHLTLMDAFGPASIPHGSKHVPMLGKRVASKVFNSLFPLAHVANGDEVTLIHPNGVNLGDYETRLDRQVQVYWDRLSKLAWAGLSEEKQASLTSECGEEGGGSGIPSYKENRTKYREAMSDSGWPRPQKDFDLLEEEIELGGNFKKYLKALKKEAVRSGSRNETHRESRSHSSLSDYTQWSEGDGEVVGLYSPSSLSSLRLDKLAKTAPYPVFPKLQDRHKRQAAPCRRHRKGQHVVVRPNDEAFYYPGVVVGYADRKRVAVQLVDKQQVTAPTDDIIIVGGAGPCPMLATGDYVLARVRTKNGPHPSAYGGLSDCYIPGTVQGRPKDARKGGALYLVLDFSGKGVGCSRHGIIKIGRSKYNELCKFIKEKGIRPLSIAEDDDEDFSSQTHSRLNSARGSIHIPSASPHPSPHPSPHLSDIPRATNLRSHSGSRASSARSAQSHSGSRASIPEGRQASSQQNPPSFPESEEVKMLLEQQKVQGELLERQQRELSLMVLRQQELEEQLRETKHSEIAEREEDSPDFFQSPGPDIATPPPPTDSTEVVTNPSPTTTSSSSLEGEGPVLREQSVNTDVWTEDRGMVTDPMTESRGVGTEWSDSSTQSEPESDSESVLDNSNESSPNVSPTHDHVIKTPPSSLTLSPPQSSVATPLPTPLATPVEEADQHFETTPPSATPTTVTPVHTASSSLMESSQLQGHAEEEDPLINQYVLARWPDDGWYYRGVVVRHLGEMWYQVRDASQDIEKIHALDIIIDLQDAQKPLLAGDTVSALHPCFNRSYAPGVVKGVAADGLHFSVVLYDGTETFLPRQEIYRLARAKYQQDVEFLRKKEKVWVGQAVLARREKDGLYLPGEVVKQLSGACRYLVEWADGSTQVQDITHMFGKLTKRRGLRQGDHVLALAVPDQGVCMPGTIKGKVKEDLLVEFCDGESSLVNPVECFWLSSEYYQQAVEFIADNVTASSLTSVGSLSTLGRQQRTGSESEVTSEYTK